MHKFRFSPSLASSPQLFSDKITTSVRVDRYHFLSFPEDANVPHDSVPVPTLFLYLIGELLFNIFNTIHSFVHDSTPDCSLIPPINMQRTVLIVTPVPSLSLNSGLVHTTCRLDNQVVLHASKNLCLQHLRYFIRSP